MNSHQNTSPAKTIGVLHCGDLGAALAALFAADGCRVVTTCEGRSQATCTRAAESGADVLESVEAVARNAHVVFSAVSPEAAPSVAAQYARFASIAPRDSIFVDINSVDLATVRSIAGEFAAVDVAFVDGAVHGGAARLQDMGVAYLSGAGSERVAQAIAGRLRVRTLGSEIGLATSMKLLMGGLSKSLNVLYLELGEIARSAGLTDDFLSECGEFYPEIYTAIQRMLPTYPRHAARRVVELQAVEDLAARVGCSHPIVTSARQRLMQAAGMWEHSPPAPASSIRQLINSLAVGEQLSSGGEDV